MPPPIYATFSNGFGVLLMVLWIFKLKIRVFVPKLATLVGDGW
jgi:hypothetical protein